MQDEGDYERPPTMSTTVTERQTRLLLTIQVHSLSSAVVCADFQLYCINCTVLFQSSSFLLLRPNAYQEKDNWHATEIPKNLFLQVFFFSQVTSERYFSFVTNHLYT